METTCENYTEGVGGSGGSTHEIIRWWLREALSECEIGWVIWIEDCAKAAGRLSSTFTLYEKESH